MPPKPAKRKAEVSNEDEGDYFTAPEHPKKKTRTSAARNDNEHANAELFKSWAECQSTFNEKDKEARRKFAEEFKKNREKGRETIQSMFKKATEDIANAGKKYAELFKEACVDIAPSVTPKSIGYACEDQPLFKTGQTLVKSCRKLVATHEQANDKTATRGTNQISKKHKLWDRDIAQIEKVLLYSAQLGEKLIACNVQLVATDEEDREQLLIPPHDALKGEGEFAVDIHKRSTERLLNAASTWGEDAFLYMEKFADLVATCETKTGKATV